MNETLLAETLGEDTTTQLYKDGDGGFHIRVMALPEPGAECARASDSPEVFHDQPVSEEEARTLYRAAAARRYVEEAQAFPAG